jgi:hypothetical protein
VATWVLRGDDLTQVVIALTTKLEAIEASSDAVYASELLPGEDPSLLGYPDRNELFRVRAYAPATVPAGTH